MVIEIYEKLDLDKSTVESILKGLSINDLDLGESEPEEEESEEEEEIF
jgi:hypothetical protein